MKYNVIKTANDIWFLEGGCVDSVRMRYFKIDKVAFVYNDIQLFDQLKLVAGKLISVDFYIVKGIVRKLVMSKFVVKQIK